MGGQFDIFDLLRANALFCGWRGGGKHSNVVTSLTAYFSHLQGIAISEEIFF